jgi:GMP synthase (glutamine-hydrolysing)
VTRTAVAIRHVEFENLGLLARLLAEHGFETSYLDAPTADGRWSRADEAELLVVLGGPIGAGDVDAYPFLEAELEIIRRRLVADRPTLGICLGAQLLAVAYGGSVRAAAAPEIGYAPVTLTDAGHASPLQALEDVPVLHWHGDAICRTAGLSPLAFTPDCDTQAFARGPNVLGLQFHLEADGALLERWLVGHAYELGARGIDVNALRRDADRYGPHLAATAAHIFSAWLAGLNEGRAVDLQ